MTAVTKPRSVAIVGAGIAGLSTAFHLAEKGVGKILLVDKGEVGDGSSRRAGAMNTMLMSTETATRFRAKSMDIFTRFSGFLDGYTFHQSGCLGLYSPEQYAALEPDQDMHRRAGGEFEILRAREIEQRFPDLRVPDEIVGVLDHRGGWSEPDVYIPALTAKVRELGVDIREHDALTDFIVEHGRVQGVRTEKSGDLRCDAVVCTVNAWANHVLAHVGRRLPFKNFVHERFVTFPFDRAPRLPATNHQAAGTYVRPTEDNRLLMGTATHNPPEFDIPRPDFEFTELQPDPASITYLKEVMTECLPMWKDAKFDYHRVGLISIAMDSQPVVGPVGELPGLYLAVNFHSGGFGHHPAAGFFLAEWMVDGETGIDISEFSPDRFADDARDAFLANPMTHHEIWAAGQDDVYKMRPIVRRH